MRNPLFQIRVIIIGSNKILFVENGFVNFRRGMSENNYIKIMVTEFFIKTFNEVSMNQNIAKTAICAKSNDQFSVIINVKLVITVGTISFLLNNRRKL